MLGVVDRMKRTGICQSPMFVVLLVQTANVNVI